MSLKAVKFFEALRRQGIYSSLDSRSSCVYFPILEMEHEPNFNFLF